MADHLRKQIRDAAVADLTGLATTGSKVRPSAVWPIGKGGLPVLLVYTLKEDVEHISAGRGGTRRQQRTVELVVEGGAEGTEETLDDTLDLIGKEVETRMIEAAHVDDTAALYSLIHDLRLGEVELAFDRSGAKPMGSVKMTYQVDWQGQERDPTTVT